MTNGKNRKDGEGIPTQFSDFSIFPPTYCDSIIPSPKGSHSPFLVFSILTPSLVQGDTLICQGIVESPSFSTFYDMSEVTRMESDSSTSISSPGFYNQNFIQPYSFHLSILFKLLVNTKNMEYTICCRYTIYTIQLTKKEYIIGALYIHIQYIYNGIIVYTFSKFWRSNCWLKLSLYR